MKLQWPLNFLTKGSLFYDVRTWKFEDVKKKNMYMFAWVLPKEDH